MAPEHASLEELGDAGHAQRQGTRDPKPCLGEAGRGGEHTQEVLQRVVLSPRM